VLGPAEAPLALVRGRYRFRLLVKTEREIDLQGYLGLGRLAVGAGNDQSREPAEGRQAGDLAGGGLLGIRALARVAEPPPGVMVLGPAEAPLALVRGRYRFRPVAAAHERQRRLGGAEHHHAGRRLGDAGERTAMGPVISALISGDAERFYSEETAAREVAGLPPFGRLAALVIPWRSISRSVLTRRRKR
jgi:primosomal protein N'